MDADKVKEIEVEQVNNGFVVKFQVEESYKRQVRDGKYRPVPGSLLMMCGMCITVKSIPRLKPCVPGCWRCFQRSERRNELSVVCRHHVDHRQPQS